MVRSEKSSRLRVGQQAPDFKLLALGRPVPVSLADYRDRTALLLVLNRGLWCSFCRRYLVQLARVVDPLKALGVEMLVVVATTIEPIRFYTERRPIGVPIAGDPDVVTHRMYGLPMMDRPAAELEPIFAGMRLRLDQRAFDRAELAQLVEAIPSTRGNPASEIPFNDLRAAQGRLYPHDLSEGETRERERNAYVVPTGQFLIDRHGVVQWTAIQGINDSPAGLANLPTEQEVLAAARALAP